MECFDISNAMYSLLGVTLIVAGNLLMSQSDKVGRGYGSYCFALGFFILGLAASGQNINNIDFMNHRYLLAIASVIAIIAGHFINQYHMQNKTREAIQKQLSGEQVSVESIPMIINVLVYAGYAGLVIAIGLNSDNSFNLVKCSLALGAVLVIGYTRNMYIKSIMSGESVDKHQLAHILSYVLLVLAISYSC